MTESVSHEGPPLITYLGDSKLKADFLAEIGKHEAADQIISGTYGEWDGQKFTACAIGCSLHSLNILQDKAELCKDTGVHDRYEAELGLPTWLAYLEDSIFERLDGEAQTSWPRRFAEAVPVGAVVDNLVLAKILRWTLGAETYGARYAATDPAVVAVVDRMVVLFDRTISGNEPPSSEWDEAARDVWAARDARAAWAARDARAVWAARDVFYPALSEYVLSLLRELPVKEGGAQ